MPGGGESAAAGAERPTFLRLHRDGLLGKIGFHGYHRLMRRIRRPRSRERLRTFARRLPERSRARHPEGPPRHRLGVGPGA